MKIYQEGFMNSIEEQGRQFFTPFVKALLGCKFSIRGDHYNFAICPGNVENVIHQNPLLGAICV